MTTTETIGSSGAGPAIKVRPPQQRRTRNGWQRVLDAAGELLSERGEAGLTVGAVCERAGVAPSALYSRVRNREELLLVAFDHMQARVTARELRLDELADGARSVTSTASAVEALVAVVRENERFLRAAILSSGSNDEIAKRGAAHVERLRGRFVAALVGNGVGATRSADAHRVFSVLFPTLIVAAGYGTRFTRGPALDDPELVEDFRRVAEGVLGAGPRS